MKSSAPNPDQPSMDIASGLPLSFDPPAAQRREHTASGLPHDERQRIIVRLRWLARLLDDAVTIPGTNYSIGLDPIIGLAPGIGDAVSLAISAYIIFEGHRLGASRRVLALMAANVAVDALVGVIPVAGDFADFVFKANQRNLRLLGITPAMPGEVL